MSTEAPASAAAPALDAGTVAVVLPRTLGAAPLIDATTDAGRDALRSLYAVPASARTPGSTDSSFVRVNMIASINGSSVGSDGTSESLTSRIDRTILGLIRAASDVVLVGAASVRAEGYQVPRAAPLAVLTASGDLSGHRLERATGSRVLLVVPASRAHAIAEAQVDRGFEVVPVADDDGRMSPTAVLTALADLGLRSVVCEGGPSVTAQFVSAGVVDEICLTTAPVVFGPGLPVMAPELLRSAERYELAHLAVDASSASYARWTRRPSSGRP